MKNYIENFKNERLKHAYIFLYPVFYMICFILLEKKVEPQYIVEFKIDSYIPFVEFFIVPYLLWFAYVALTVAIFYFFLDIGDFYRMTCYLFSGMTIFLIVSFIFPNGLDLRPDSFPRDNIFTDLVKALYKTDTSTNVIPSIHVFNSLCVHIGISKNDTLRKKPLIVNSSLVLMILIILSTMFLKQHSVLDVISGIFMAIVLYPVFYTYNIIPYRNYYPIEKKQVSIIKNPA